MIIYFSGNGNSRLVAEKLSYKLDTDILELHHGILTNPSRQSIYNDGKPIVWVFPVYSWGVPPVIVKFIKECNIDGAETVNHHLVVTCGDDTGYTDRQWRKLITARGWNPLSATSVLMPNTYVCMKGFDIDSNTVAIDKIENSQQYIEKAIKNILSNNDIASMHRGAFPWIKSHIIYPWFIRHAMSPRPFHYTSECSGCGLCARQCPMDNIHMNHRGAPQWGDNCAMCLRCYHRCPVHAVAYGNTTSNKGQYRGPQTLIK